MTAKPSDLTDERLETLAKGIETTHANAALHIAAQLSEARDIFRYRHDEGGFGGWVETRLRYSRSTAYNLLSTHERFGGTKNLSKRLDTFPASILYLLAAPSTPQEARDEIIERAEAGEEITVAKTKTAIAKRKPKPKQPSRKPRKPTTKPQANTKSKHDTADDFGADSRAEATRLRARIEELQAQVRQRDITIEGLRRDIAELQKTSGDPMSVSAFQAAIKKWEETVETQRGIIARLENENADLRAQVAAPPDDDLDIPASLRRAPR